MHIIPQKLHILLNSL